MENLLNLIDDGCEDSGQLTKAIEVLVGIGEVAEQDNRGSSNGAGPSSSSPRIDEKVDEQTLPLEPEIVQVSSAANIGGGGDEAPPPLRGLRADANSTEGGQGTGEKSEILVVSASVGTSAGSGGGTNSGSPHRHFNLLFNQTIGEHIKSATNGGAAPLRSEAKLTLLELAVERQNNEAVRQLLRYRADPNQRLGLPCSALCRVAYNFPHNVAMMRVLLQYGANPDATTNADLASASCLIISVVKDNAEAVGLLLEYGADVGYEWKGSNAFAMATDFKKEAIVHLFEAKELANAKANRWRRYQERKALEEERARVLEEKKAKLKAGNNVRQHYTNSSSRDSGSGMKHQRTGSSAGGGGTTSNTSTPPISPRQQQILLEGSGSGNAGGGGVLPTPPPIDPPAPLPRDLPHRHHHQRTGSRGSTPRGAAAGGGVAAVSHLLLAASNNSNQGTSPTPEEKNITSAPPGDSGEKQQGSVHVLDVDFEHSKREQEEKERSPRQQDEEQETSSSSPIRQQQERREQENAEQKFSQAMESMDWLVDKSEVEVDNLISAGAHGEVFKCTLKSTGDLVALKKFMCIDEKGRDTFRKEVSMCSRFRHENIVLFRGAVIDPDLCGLLSELCPRDLYSRLHIDPAPNWSQRLIWARDIARAMTYLHTRNPPVVHRDLKSMNVLLDQTQVVKLCDFGMARVKEHTFITTKHIAGSPSWMAPEVLRGDDFNDQSDIYSFGVILWELLTLQTPWPGKNMAQLVGLVGFSGNKLKLPHPEKLPPECPAGFLSIIESCWSSTPTERPPFRTLRTLLENMVKQHDSQQQQQQEDSSSSGSGSGAPHREIASLE